MKIFIAASWIRLGGGVTRSLLELIKHIDFSKHSVTLMLMDLDKQVLPLIPKEINLIVTKDSFQTDTALDILKKTLKSGKVFTALSYGIEQLSWRKSGNNYKHQQWIVKHMEKQKDEYDVAISYAMMNSIVNTYVIEKVNAKKKILWCHIDINLYKDKYIHGLGVLYEKYDKINCVSQAALESLKARYPSLSDKLYVTYNYIDSDIIIKNTPDNIDIDIPENRLKLCTVGRITDQKGIDILVDVAHKLSLCGIKFVWWVVGTRYNDEFNLNVENKIKEYGLENTVLLLGEKNPPYAFMRDCDIYVQPSRYEGFCLTTSEAKAFARPCVVTNFSGASEQFTDGIDANIVDVSVNSIFEAIKDLCESEEKRKMYSDNLRNNPKALNFITFEEMIS